MVAWWQMAVTTLAAAAVVLVTCSVGAAGGGPLSHLHHPWLDTALRTPNTHPSVPGPPGLHRRPQGVDGALRRPQGVDGGLRRPQGVDGGLRRPQGVDGGLRRPQGVDGSLRRPQGADGGLRRPQGADGGLRRPQGADGGLRRPQGLPSVPEPSGSRQSDRLNPWWYDLDQSVWFDPRYSENHRWGNESNSEEKSDQNPEVVRKTLTNYSSRNSLDYMLGYPSTVVPKVFRSPPKPSKHPLDNRPPSPPADMIGSHLGLLSLFISALTIFFMMLSALGINAKSPLDLTDVFSGPSGRVSHPETVQSRIAEAVTIFNKKFPKEEEDNKEEDDNNRKKRSSSVLKRAIRKSMIPVDQENSFRPGDQRMGRQFDPLSQIAMSAAMVIGAYAGYALINTNQQKPGDRKANVKRNPSVKEEDQKLVFEDGPRESNISVPDTSEPDSITMNLHSDYLNIQQNVSYPRPLRNNDTKQYTSPYSSSPPSQLTKNLKPTRLHMVPATHLEGSLQETQGTKKTTGDGYHGPPNSGPSNPSRLGKPTLSTATNYFSDLAHGAAGAQTLESLPVINLWGTDATLEDHINLNVIPAISGSSPSLVAVHDLLPHLIPITHSDSQLRDPPDLYTFVMKDDMLPSGPIKQEGSGPEPPYPSYRPETLQPQQAGVADSERHEELTPSSVFFRPETLKPHQPEELSTKFYEEMETSGLNFRPNTPRPFQSQVLNTEGYVIVQSPEVNFRPLTPSPHQPEVLMSEVHGLVEGYSDTFLKPSTPKPHQFEVLNSDSNSAVEPSHMYVKPAMSYSYQGEQLTSQPHRDQNTDDLWNKFAPGGGKGTLGHRPQGSDGHQTFDSPPIRLPGNTGTYESLPWSENHYEDANHVSGHDTEEDHMEGQQPGIFIKITIPGHVPASSKVQSSSANDNLTPSYHIDTNYRPEEHSEQVHVHYTNSEPSGTLHYNHKPSFIRPSQLSTESDVSNLSWQQVPLTVSGHQGIPGLVRGQQNTQEESVSPGHTPPSSGSSPLRHKLPGHQPQHTHLPYGPPQDAGILNDQLQDTSDPTDYSDNAELYPNVTLDEETFNTLLKLATQELESLQGHYSAPPRNSFHQTNGQGYSFSTGVVTNVPDLQNREEGVYLDDYKIRPSLYVNGKRVDKDLSPPEEELGGQEENITFPSELLNPAILSDLDEFLQALLTNLNTTSSYKGLIVPKYISNITHQFQKMSRDYPKRDKDLELNLLLEIISKTKPSGDSHHTTAPDTASTDGATNNNNNNTNRSSVNTGHNGRRHTNLSRPNHISNHSQSSTSVQEYASRQGHEVPVSTDEAHATTYNQDDKPPPAGGLVTWPASQRLSTWSSVWEKHGASSGDTGGAASLLTQGLRRGHDDGLGTLLSSSYLTREDSETAFSPLSFHRSESPVGNKIHYPSVLSRSEAAAKTRPSLYSRYNIKTSAPVTGNMHLKYQEKKIQNRLTLPSDTEIISETGPMSEMPDVLAHLTKKKLRPVIPPIQDTSPQIPSKNILHDTYPYKRPGRPLGFNRSIKRKGKHPDRSQAETTSAIPLSSKLVVTSARGHFRTPPTTRHRMGKEQTPTFGFDLGITPPPPTPDTARDSSQDPSLPPPAVSSQNSENYPSFHSAHSLDSPSAASFQSSNTILSEQFQYSLIPSQYSDSPPSQISQYTYSPDSESIHVSDPHHSQSFQYSDSFQSPDSPPTHSQQSPDPPRPQPPPSGPSHTTSRTSLNSPNSYYRTSPKYSLNVPINLEKESREPLFSPAPPTEGSPSSMSPSTSTSSKSTKASGSLVVSLMSRFLCRHVVHHEACAVCMEEVGHRPECLIRRP